MSETEYFELIKKHGLEVNFVEDPEEASWSVFPCKKGGTWGHGETLEDAISECIQKNHL